MGELLNKNQNRLELETGATDKVYKVKLSTLAKGCVFRVVGEGNGDPVAAFTAVTYHGGNSIYINRDSNIETSHIYCYYKKTENDCIYIKIGIYSFVSVFFINNPRNYTLSSEDVTETFSEEGLEKV